MKTTAGEIISPAVNAILPAGNPALTAVDLASFGKEMRLVRGKWIIETVVVVAIILGMFLLFNKYIGHVSQGYQARVNAALGMSEAELIREFKPQLLSKEDYERHQRGNRTSVRLSAPYAPRVYFDGEGFDVAYFFVRDGKVTTVLLGKT